MPCALRPAVRTRRLAATRLFPSEAARGDRAAYVLHLLRPRRRCRDLLLVRHEQRCSGDCPATERATLALTDEMTRSIKVSRRNEEADPQVLPDGQVIQLIRTIAGHHMASRFLVATGVELE